ncbi:MAG: shikimate kinase [Chloroflexota bacterium]|nr:shikimate kinase [Chloroflexota bacterium]
MVEHRNILLVGFMGSGKTTVGNLLANLLQWPMVDTDDQIISQMGRSIDSIFREYGEEQFRTIERAVIADLCGKSQQVIASGGGAFADPANRSIMLASGKVFFLKTSPEILLERMRKDESIGAAVRPLLSGDMSVANIADLLSGRVESYSMAHYSVETDGRTTEEVADMVLNLYSGECS